jgi:hypothetical protein
MRAMEHTGSVALLFSFSAISVTLVRNSFLFECLIAVPGDLPGRSNLAFVISHDQRIPSGL